MGPARRRRRRSCGGVGRAAGVWARGRDPLQLVRTRARRACGAGRARRGRRGLVRRRWQRDARVCVAASAPAAGGRLKSTASSRATCSACVPPVGRHRRGLAAATNWAAILSRPKVSACSSAATASCRWRITFRSWSWSRFSARWSTAVGTREARVLSFELLLPAAPRVANLVHISERAGASRERCPPNGAALCRPAPPGRHGVPPAQADQIRSESEHRRGAGERSSLRHRDVRSPTASA